MSTRSESPEIMVRPAQEADAGPAAATGEQSADPSATDEAVMSGHTRVPRRSVKQQTVYLPLPVYEQLRRLAFEERVKMHALLMEGLDRVFHARGLPSLMELKEPGPAAG